MVRIMQMNCGDCQYWTKEENKGWNKIHGRCTVINESSRRLAWLWNSNDDDWGDLSLITEPEFNCNQWKEKIDNEQ